MNDKSMENKAECICKKTREWNDILGGYLTIITRETHCVPCKKEKEDNNEQN